MAAKIINSDLDILIKLWLAGEKSVGTALYRALELEGFPWVKPETEESEGPDSYWYLGSRDRPLAKILWEDDRVNGRDPINVARYLLVMWQRDHMGREWEVKNYAEYELGKTGYKTKKDKKRVKELLERILCGRERLGLSYEDMLAKVQGHFPNSQNTGRKQKK